MAAVRLVCWNDELAKERARVLKKAGVVVDASPFNPAGMIGRLREHPPSAFLIDLDRLPSHGREVGVAVRNSKALRHIPIVFAGGVEAKVLRIRAELPDAFFTSWASVAQAIMQALTNAPDVPVEPPPHMTRYAGSSLAKKLGFAPKAQAALLGAPEGFEETLGDLPEGASIARKITSHTRMALWFVHSRSELDAAAEASALRLPDGASVWIIHPKQAGRYRVDFNQNDVRAAGLAVGLVDYKVCAVDSDWSGLKFARRKV